MTNPIVDRRFFLKTAAAFTASTRILNTPSTAIETSPISKPLKAIQLQMLPEKLSDPEKFQLAKQCGYRGIEATPLGDLDSARKQANDARAAGVEIHSVLYGWWPAGLGDPKVARKSITEMENALHCAQAMGATAVLLVPSRVTDDYSYSSAYKDSQQLIRQLIPLAQELKVVIAVENVWNKFLLSPIEFARYIDEFESPWVRAYFDIGNVIIYGFSQDWIRTLGPRIARIHLKDFKRSGYQWTPLGEGDVNWPQVTKALTEIGYQGYLTPELKGGDEPYLTELAQRIERLIPLF